MIENKLIVLNPTTTSFTGNYCEPDAHGLCATCSDEALPARVLGIDETGVTAVVEMNGKPVEVDVSLLDEIHPGQVLLVHGGVAVGSLEEETRT